MTETFTYPLVHRITSYPALIFLIVLFVVILAAPETLWSEDPDPDARRAALIFLGLMVLVVGAAAVRKLREPFEVTLSPDELSARRTVGNPLDLSYDDIENISEHPRTFLHPVPELRIEGAGTSIPVNARIEKYDRLRALVVARANPLAIVELAADDGKPT
jgi:hypothetical protein